MKVIKKKEFLKNKEKYIEWIKDGAVFLYPTDTIYGIGCNATKPGPVKWIRKTKGGGRKSPFSVIAPGKEWIRKNCKTNEKYLKKLPGPYTLIFKMKKRCVSVECSRESLGVRIPKNWFSKIVEEAGVPVVTTSVNKHGEKPATGLKNVPKDIKRAVDFAIEDGIIKNPPSTIIDLRRKKAKVIRRTKKEKKQKKRK